MVALNIFDNRKSSLCFGFGNILNTKYGFYLKIAVGGIEEIYLGQNSEPFRYKIVCVFGRKSGHKLAEHMYNHKFLCNKT